MLNRHTCQLFVTKLAQLPSTMSFRLTRTQLFQRTRALSITDQDYRWAISNSCNVGTSRNYRLIRRLAQPETRSDEDNGTEDEQAIVNNNNNNNNKDDPTIVFLAVHNASAHKVVVKRIDLDDLVDLEEVEYEVKRLKHLHHSNVVPLLASFVDKRFVWNVFTYAEFGSADQCAKPNGLAELAIAFIVKDVLAALSYLHKRGMIHRAVRGSHVLITSKGTCLLTGMKYMTTVLRNLKWQPVIHEYPRNSVTNLQHLAPEIIEQTPSGYNAKSDIYSVGVLCAELANGRVPLDDSLNTQMLLDKLVGNHPRPLDANSPELISYSYEPQDMPPAMKTRLECYKNRTFSLAFHRFVAEACTMLFTDRPTADKLLNHLFIRSASSRKKNLLASLPRVRSASDEGEQELSLDLGRLQLEDGQDKSTNQFQWDFVN